MSNFQQLAGSTIGFICFPKKKRLKKSVSELTVRLSVADAAKLCRAFNEGRLPGFIKDVSLAGESR